MTNRNVRIAKQLVRIAKSLVASDDWENDTYEVDGKSGVSYDDMIEMANAAIETGKDIEIFNEDDEEEVCVCSWCHDAWPKSECEHESDMGWLCRDCLNELSSRGEPYKIDHNYR